MMIGGPVINVAAFTGGNYLARYLSGDGGPLAQKTRHDKALEAYEATQARYSQERTKLLDWIEEMTKEGELLFVGGSALALGHAAFRFL